MTIEDQEAAILMAESPLQAGFNPAREGGFPVHEPTMTERGEEDLS